MNRAQGRALKTVQHLSTSRSVRLWSYYRKLEIQTTNKREKIRSLATATNLPTRKKRSAFTFSDEMASTL